MVALNLYAALASFLGTGVEFVEALTIILAVGTIRGWRSAVGGAVAAIVVLAALVVIIGTPLVQIIQTPWVALIVGLFMLLFGIRWLRKAILRYSGLKSLHNEAESYQDEVERQKKAGRRSSGIDRFAFVTTFSGTFLEGMEAIFIVITIGLSTSNMTYSIIGAVVSIVVLLIVGMLLRAPLTKVPENTMKFVVGIMLTSFGAFWVGEGLHVHWAQKDLSILYIAGSLLALSWILITRSRAQLQTKQAAPSETVRG
ncbi:COG4280 domain-containing protein [Alicyclobacillus sp. ALC3]|uniref:COG4280 domain-containing protein n=1 Tax=Alicyclobacillus sp. ALC3 TaxID=2796143 RepID=UPI002379CECB|nr:hypothetical protein [Alicyclobacillus sp. ALC3]WDL98566.1 hypothetical protein JC200_07805 [Alicyclobacillus sp. ALC3]